jgi:hypothetical protein
VEGSLGSELERLPGVLAATVFQDSGRGAMVYLAAQADVDRGAIRSAVQTLLQDRGLVVPAERIHVGAVPRLYRAASPLPDLSFDDLEVHRVDGRIECVVRLRAAERTYGGRAREPDSVLGRARAATRAVLAAAESLDPDLRFGLHGTRELDLFGYDALMVLVEATVGRAAALLPGLVLVDGSIEESAALATVSALRSWRA